MSWDLFIAEVIVVADRQQGETSELEYRHSRNFGLCSCVAILSAAYLAEAGQNGENTWLSTQDQ